jgi:hypothetical protein
MAQAPVSAGVQVISWLNFFAMASETFTASLITWVQFRLS